MIVSMGLVFFAVFAGIYLRNRGDRTPLHRDELRRMRQVSDRIRREQILPFE